MKAQSKKKLKQGEAKDETEAKGNPPASSHQDAEMTAAQISILKVAAGNHDKSDMVNVAPLYVCMQIKEARGEVGGIINGSFKRVSACVVAMSRCRL